MKTHIPLVLVAFMLASCAPAVRAAATETAVSTSTSVPAQPTKTPTPVSASAAQGSSGAGYELGERLVYGQAGFSFQPMKDYDVIPLDIGNGIQDVILHDKAKNFSIYFMGTKTDHRFGSAGEVLAFWMPALTKNDPEGFINPVSDHPITIDNIPGIAVDVTGKLLKKPLTGQVVSLWVSNNQYLMVLGFSDAEDHADLWVTEGQIVFNAMVNTVKFLK